MTAFERVERREIVTTETVWRYAAGAATPTASIQTRSVTRYAISDARPVPMYDEGRGRLYVPVSVTVEITRGGNPDVRVMGRLQRKDGSLGETNHEIHRFGWRRADWPEWLIEIAADAATTNPRGDQ